MLLSLIQILFCSTTLSAAEATPRIVYSAALPPAMQSAVKAHDSHFVTWQQTDFLPFLLDNYKFSPQQIPSAAIGDFNGDGTPDAALWGHNKSHYLLLAILSDSKGWKVVEVLRRTYLDPKTTWNNLGKEHSGYGLIESLSFVLRQRLESPHEKSPLELRSDAFELSHFGKAAVLYYYDNGKFISYITAD